MHYTKGPAKFEKLCVHLGVQSFSDACPEYTPDMIKIAKVEPDALTQLATLASKLTQAQMRIFAYVFRNMDFIKKAGFDFGQTVVFSMSGQDYLDNYVRGKVIGADRTGGTLYISSDFEGLNKESVFLSLLRPDVLTVAGYKAKREKLISQGRIGEPKPEAGSSKRTLLQCLKMSKAQHAEYRAKLQAAPEKYVPPALDAVPADWIDSRSVDSMMDVKTGKKASKKKMAVQKDGSIKMDRYAKKSTAKRAGGAAKPVPKASRVTKPKAKAAAEAVRPRKKS